MTARSTSLMIAVSLITLSACSKKPPKLLPPPPLETSGAATTTPSSTTPAIIAGSQEDFVSKISSDRIFFDTDSADVDETDRTTLQSQAAWFARYPAVRVTVEGHADERGTRDYNLALGERRANAAKNALVALGVGADRITTISYGKERPDATGSDEEAYARNRRAVSVTAR
jgi:peptidoglycan-associated lipoprotein